MHFFRNDLWRMAGRCLWYASMTFASVVGCGEIEGNPDFFGAGGRRPKPIPIKSVNPTSIQINHPKPTNTQHNVPKERHTSVTHPTLADVGFYQLVLHGEPGPEREPSGMRYVELHNVTARHVGELLSWLYIPSGASGTVGRYTLVYPTQIEWKAAAAVVSKLDVVVTESGSDANVQLDEGWSVGIALIHTTPAGHPDEVARLQQATACLSRAAHAENLARWDRWAAGMLAGHIAAYRLHDDDNAEAYYRTAESLTSPGLLEQMSTMYARAQVHVREGKLDVARQLLNSLLRQFEGFRLTETFARARRRLNELGAKK